MTDEYFMMQALKEAKKAFEDEEIPIAAGNCVVLKPSEFAPATDAVMKKIIEETFPKEYILYVQGDGAAVIPEMMNNFTFDHVFYTGSTAV